MNFCTNPRAYYLYIKNEIQFFFSFFQDFYGLYVPDWNEIGKKILISTCAMTYLQFRKFILSLGILHFNN